MTAAWIRARAVLRRHWRSTVFLALFAGLAGGAVTSAWSWSRRAHSVVPRRLDAFVVPDGTFQSCPPGADPTVDLAPCLGPESNQAAFDALVRSRHVAAAKLYVGFAVAVTTETSDDPQLRLASAIADQVGDIARMQVARGTPIDGLAGDEVVLSEATAAGLDVGIGDEIALSVCATVFDGAPVDCAGSSSVRVAGIARVEGEILPERESPPGVVTLSETFGIFTRHDWWDVHHADRMAFLTASFRLTDGSSLADLRADLPALLPGYTTLVTPYEDLTVQDALRDATQLQGRTLFVVALILLIAAAVFVGQALLRQVPRELNQHATLRALGTDRRGLLSATMLRSLPIALVAALVAAATTIVASGFGPTGLAARAEIDSGARVDVPVTVLGAATVAVFVVVVLVAAAWRTTHGRSRRARRRGRVPAGVSPVVQAGLMLGRGHGAARSIAGAAGSIVAAVVAVVWAGCVIASLDRVVSTPRLYGASWDYGIGEFVSEELTEAAIADVRANPMVTGAATLVVVGPLELPSLDPVYVVSMEVLKGDLGPVILSGREPNADDEIALGPQTLAALDLEIGDTVEALPVLAAFDEEAGGGAPAGAPASVGPFTVVGTALISSNDTRAGPGDGIVATPATRVAIDPGTTGEIVVAVDQDLPEDVVLADLIERYGATLSVPTPQADIRNYDVISSIPTVIAALVAVLALGALSNALVVNVRRSRSTVAVLRTLGFTRRQVAQAVATQANGLALVAVVLGIPLGMVAAAWTWRNRAEELGVTRSLVVPVGVTVLAGVGAFVVVNLAALWPAIRAGRSDVGVALRTE